MTTQYPAGLPVWFAVYPNGDVEIEVDLSEAGRGLDEASDGVAGIDFREAVEAVCAEHGNTVKVILMRADRRRFEQPVIRKRPDSDRVYTKPKRPVVECDRCHGTWGADPGCPRCHYPEDQGPRPLTDPGPLTGDPDLSEPWPTPDGGHVRVIPQEGK